MTAPDGHFTGCLTASGDLIFRQGVNAVTHSQPMSAFRGYVANPSSVRSVLSLDGAGDLTDAALVGRAAERWGGELSLHVLGEYAAAVYTAASKRLLLTHDTLGIGSLFYEAKPDRICFATCLENLFSWITAPRLDDQYIVCHLSGNPEFGRRTPYAGVLRLLPGESLLWTAGVLSRQRSWPFTRGRRPRLVPPADREHELRRLIAEGVQAAVPRRGPVWCELSGGLDSTTVLAYAAKQNRRRITACSTIYPRSSIADEQVWIAHALRDYDVPWRALDGDSRLPFDRPFTGFVGEPTDRLITQGIIALYDEALRAGGVDVVLTGQGGDAVFLGDGAGPVYLADMLRDGRIRSLAQAVRGLVKRSGDKRSSQYWLSRYAVAPLLRSWRGQVLDGYFHRSRPPPWLRDHYIEGGRVRARSRQREMLVGPTLAATVMLERISAVVTGFTRHNNHPSAAAEFRHPLLYRPLVEYMLGVPGELASSPEIDRALQRQALVGILPEPIRRRRDKAGRGQIFYNGLERSAFWQDRLTRSPMIVELGYADRDRWRSAIRAATLGHSGGIGSLLAAITLEEWLRQFNVGSNGALTLSSASS